MSALLADALVLLGCAGLTLALLGIARLPDTPSRVHAASAGVYLGVIPILLAAPLVADGPTIARAALIAAWLVLTPVAAGHAIVRAWARQDLPPAVCSSAMNPQQISLETVLDFLVNAPLFEALDQAELAEVVRIMHVVTLQSGEQVFREGETGDAWYVIYEGQAEVLKELGDGATRHLSLLFPGTCFGEMGVVDQSPRSATVRAVGTLVVFRFRRKEFDEMIEDGSLAAYKLVAAMARIISQRHRRLTLQLSELLERHEPTEELDRAQLGELIGRYETAD